MSDSLSHRTPQPGCFFSLLACVFLACGSMQPGWGQTSGNILETFPRSIVEALAADDPEATPLGTEPSLAPELGAALAGENATLETRDLGETLPFSTNRASSQPLAIRTPKDPLSARKKPKATLQFQIRSGVEYNDNIFISGDDPEDDLIMTVAPTLAVNAGDFRQQEATYLSAAYTATGSTYVKGSADETLDHLVELAGQLKRKKVTVPFGARLARETGAFLDLGGRDTAQIYEARLGADYALSSKLSVGLAGEYSATDYSQFADFSSHLVEAYLSHRHSSKTTLSGVYRYNKTQTDGADSQTYQAALVRIDTAPSSKVNGLLEAGIAFSSLGKGDRSDLIYRLGLAYQPNRKQRLSLEATRGPSTSAFTLGSGSINNSLQLTYEHALGRKARLILSGGYQLQDYFAADRGAVTDRRDEYFAFSSLLAYDINPHWQAEVYYTHSDNSSTDPLLGFENQRVGMGLTWSY